MMGAMKLLIRLGYAALRVFALPISTLRSDELSILKGRQREGASMPL
jgi:hypothetical protein